MGDEQQRLFSFDPWRTDGLYVEDEEWEGSTDCTSDVEETAAARTTEPRHRTFASSRTPTTFLRQATSLRKFYNIPLDTG